MRGTNNRGAKLPYDTLLVPLLAPCSTSPVQYSTQVRDCSPALSLEVETPGIDKVILA